MTDKSTEQTLALPHSIEKTELQEVADKNDFVFDLSMFDAKAVSDLEVICRNAANEKAAEELPKSASVKFMITAQDEKELREIGYSQEQINRITPQEAENIIRKHSLEKQR
ncbi:MAG: hypothetical protein PHN84_00565 [Desulfuromonadaceae bacterium]|nr:hypothetical protein [Desulfuromonadaceae bacterium]MDD2855320.1 hypothetical protein [Desulfuromonadaceae bacterium]